MNQTRDKKAAIRAEQVRLLFAASPVSLVTSAILALLLGVVQWSVIEAPQLLGWLVLLGLALGARFVLLIAYRRSAAQDIDSQTWLRRFRIGAAASGLAWGLAGFLLYPPNDVPHQVALAYTLAGVATGAVIAYSIEPVSATVFVLLAFLPLVVSLFGEGGNVALTMGAMGTLFIFYVAASVRFMHRNLHDNIRLRLAAASREDALREREASPRATHEQLAALVEAIPDAIFFKDGEGRWLITNEPAKRLFHLHVIPWQGKTEMELAALQPEFRAVHEACLAEDEKAWQAGRLSLSEERVAGEDGRLHDLDVRKVPLFDDQGQRQGLVVIGRDVTERKQAEQELRIAATAFDTQEGIMVTDADNVILRVNRAFTRLTGYSAEEAVGQTPARLRSGRHDQEFYRAMWASLERDKFWQGEIWNRRKDGEIQPQWLTITAVVQSDGKVTHYVAALSDMTLYKQAEAEIHNLAFYDPLTGLPNRRLLLDRLQHTLISNARHQKHGAILFLDLDNFKTLNDTRGHDIGDLLLVEVARRVKDCVRRGDTVARLGGDEFVVMLVGLSAEPEQAAAQAELVAGNIREHLNQPYRLKGHEHYSSASIGISMFLDPEVKVDEVLRRADAAMYQAKQSGRNALRFFDPAMQAALEARVALEADLRHALAGQQLKLYYHLQVDSYQRIVGAEVLLRWEHPQRGMVFPAQFIPLAEETGQIIPIGFWVLSTACTQLKAWESDAHSRDLQLAVNVSVRQFRQPDFVEEVRRILQSTGANPRRLTLELTESLVLNNVTDVVAKMQALKEIGIRFAMDDFGTGQSSLTHLKHLPLDQIKIDQSFVRDIAKDKNDEVMVCTIISMARHFGLDIIAEGVETDAQLAFLMQHGCSAFQGYLFGKPVLIDEFERILRR